MALKNLDTVLAESTVDLAKLHRIYVNPTGAVPFYNKYPETAFEVDAKAKGIRVVHLSKDRKSYVAGDYVVVLGADGQTVQVVANASKDVFDAMSQPHLVKVPAGADAGRAVLTGFRHYLAGTFDGLFAGAPVKVEVDEDIINKAGADHDAVLSLGDLFHQRGKADTEVYNAGVRVIADRDEDPVEVDEDPVVMTSFTLDKTEITGKVGDVVKVTVNSILPDNTTNKGIDVGSSDKTIATAVDNLDGSYSITLVKKGTTAVHWVAVDGGGAKKDFTVTVSAAV